MLGAPHVGATLACVALGLAFGVLQALIKISEPA